MKNCGVFLQLPTLISYTHPHHSLNMGAMAVSETVASNLQTSPFWCFADEQKLFFPTLQKQNTKDQVPITNGAGSLRKSVS